NIFLSTLLPEINDIVELKITLHIFCAIYQKRSYPRFVTFRELLNNTNLMNSIKEAAESPDIKLRRALEMATKRGTVLHLVLDKNGMLNDLYFLNNNSGKQIMTKIRSGELILNGLKTDKQAAVEPIEDSPDIFTIYEQNIGMLTPMIAEELREAEKLYPINWIKDAIKEAVTLNKRNWRYIARILENWTTEGRSNGTHRQDSKTDPDKYIKGKYGHMVRR
ncbi:MAG: DnaD domain protein, partial [Dehalococcoidales bacterium]|nr:DnaD domain protein [Dehalococcoidales bacterium]